MTTINTLEVLMVNLLPLINFSPDRKRLVHRKGLTQINTPRLVLLEMGMGGSILRTRRAQDTAPNSPPLQPVELLRDRGGIARLELFLADPCPPEALSISTILFSECRLYTQ